MEFPPHAGHLSRAASPRRLRPGTLIGAQALSLLGAGAQVVGLAVLAARVSPLLVAAVLAARYLPGAVVILAGGGRLDLADRHRLLRTTVAVQLAVASAAAVAFATVGPRPWLLVAVAALYSPGAYLDATAYPALLAGVARDPRRALARSTVAVRLSGVMGTLAGAAALTAGPAGPFVVNALSFVPLIVVLGVARPARPRDRDAVPAGGAAMGGGMLQVLRQAWHTPRLQAPLVTLAVLVVFAVQPLLLLAIAGSGRAALTGVLLAVFAGGGMVVGLSRPVDPLHHGVWLTGLGAVLVPVTAALATSAAVVLVAAAFLTGVLTGLVGLHAVWICAELPETMTVRAFGLWQVLNNGATALGAPLAALAGRVLGVAPAWWCAAWALVAAAAGAAMMRRRAGRGMPGHSP